MDNLGKVSFENNFTQLAKAIQDLSKQVQELQQSCREENERLAKFKESNKTVEFTLVTSGLIRGKILWIGEHSLGIKTESDKNVILYKHAIAFVQERAK